eukprot:PLAT11828.1.p1 GENE.PLAT11828.1~~PLAT11828.1.p1  ORF type:complete len:450 (-),score=160.32 PLAT11828.1:40-1389(-)
MSEPAGSKPTRVLRLHDTLTSAWDDAVVPVLKAGGWSSVQDLQWLLAELRLLPPPTTRPMLSGLDSLLSNGPDEQQRHFFEDTLPFIVKLVLELPALLEEEGAPACLPAETEGKTVVSRKLATRVLAAMFLGFVQAPTGGDGREDSPCPNMLQLLDHTGPQEIAKLQAILHYFDRVAEEEPRGQLTFIRSVTPDSLDWSSQDAPLSALEVLPEGVIEDAEDCLQVDFANRFIGGGVLCGGCVQEEIRFAMCPELMISMALCDVMSKREAIVMKGAECFSAHKGYAFSLQYAGDFRDESAREEDGSLKTTVVAIDAIRFHSRWLPTQMQPAAMLRDLNKAYAGFSVSGLPFSTIATGNWGCGAFNGNVQLKAVQQWMAASVAGCDMRYYTFGHELAAGLPAFAAAVREAGVTVGAMYDALTKLSTEMEAEEREIAADGLLNALSSLLLSE